MAAFVLAATGCSVNPAWTLQAPPRDAVAVPDGVLPDIPFHPQTEYQCGPAALATILGASGVETGPEALAPQVYLPGRQGSLQLELVGATRRAGRIPFVIQPTTDALLAELGEGRPVLVLQNLLVRTFPRWHYAVVTGTDRDANTLVLNSGTEQGLEMPAPRFLRTWDWAGRWGLVSLRPGQLPARAEPAAYLAAVADFEAVAGAQAARPAYVAALQRWPTEPRAHLAMGNQAYAAGDRVDAARHFQAGLAHAPTDVVLGNNQASVLGELGCLSQARARLQAVEAALDADSAWRERLAETRDELERAGARAPHPACASLE
ncbi:PA2778 family cysteine peptidase [Lysobacter sp. A3-1-A15]|uniref:PA2778 family cysteine peptidase n=1 Tax=Novilysobacter viscosus TaxID=3098602 RepID=UPI002ED90C2C